LRATIAVAGFTALRGAVNFALQVVIAAEFGAGSETDSYFVVVGSGLLMVDVVVGVLTFAALPPLVRLREGQGERSALLLESTGLVLCGATLVGAGAVLFLSAPLVIELLAPGFSPATSEFAVELLRITLPGMLLYAFALLLGLGLQIRGRFRTTAFTPVLPLIGSFASIPISGETDLTDVMVGFTAGATLALILQSIAWRRATRGHGRNVDLRDPRLLELAKPIVPVAIAFSASVVLPTALRLAASDLRPGSVAALGFAGQVVGIPIALLTTPVGTVILPRLAELMHAGSFRDGSQLLREALLVVTLASSLAGALLVGLAEPAIELLYGRGRFSDRAVALTAEATIWLAAGLAAVSASSLLGRALAAAGKVKSFAVAWLLTLALFVGGWLLLRPLGVAGLAALYSGAIAFLAVALFALARAYGAEIDLRKSVGVLLRVLLSGVVAGLVSRSFFNFVGGVPGSSLELTIALGLAAAAGTAAFLATTLALRGTEASTLRRLAVRIVSARRRGTPAI
jgi:putative peptidoglycan lipid II flippase